jgi:hypothetical protein
VATAQPASVVPPTNTPEPVSELIGAQAPAASRSTRAAGAFSTSISAAGGIFRAAPDIAIRASGLVRGFGWRTDAKIEGSAAPGSPP